jgi:hypothetical protein
MSATAEPNIIVDRLVPDGKPGLPGVSYLIPAHVDGVARPTSVPAKQRWFVYFAYGTAVQVEFPDDSKSEDYVYDRDDVDWPMEMLGVAREEREAERDRIQVENEDSFKNVTKRFPELSDAIRAAYSKLVDAGFPWPATSQADGACEYLCPCTVQEKQNSVWGVTLSDCGGDSITTLVLDGRVPVVAGVSQRRHDYCRPRVVAVCDPTLSVTYTV